MPKGCFYSIIIIIQFTPINKFNRKGKKAKKEKKDEYQPCCKRYIVLEHFSYNKSNRHIKAYAQYKQAGTIEAF